MAAGTLIGRSGDGFLVALKLSTEVAGTLSLVEDGSQILELRARDPHELMDVLVRMHKWSSSAATDLAGVMDREAQLQAERERESFRQTESPQGLEKGEAPWGRAADLVRRVNALEEVVARLMENEV